ncbi:MAG: DNA repair protein RecN (Recombination protein N) [Candidatus Azotimanducaceae bacterium]|jgi:DNA repair protein RecN (Recombination protein N)
MLQTLTIKNYALIASLEIDFQDNLSIITGETGAGKSILLGALGLLLGQRSDTKSLRDSKKKCLIEGSFFTKSPSVVSFLKSEEFDLEPELTIRREISPSGKSRAFINDSLANLNQLKALGVLLVDVHSQHETLTINSSAFQLNVLDALTDSSAIMADYLSAFAEWKKANKELKELKETSQNQQEDLEFKQFLLQELQEAKLLDPNEIQYLEEELQLLSHSEELTEHLFEGVRIMSADNTGVLEQLNTLKISLQKLAEIHSDYEGFLERLESDIIDLKDISEEIEERSSSVEFDPNRLAYIQSRIDALNRLQLKHKEESVNGLINKKLYLESELDLVLNSPEIIANKEQAVKVLKEVLNSAGEQLTTKRKEAADKLEPHIIAGCQQLGMSNACFEVSLMAANPTATGMDEVQFMFSANKGVATQELSKVASGGELSRVMLTLKALLSSYQELPTIIFDEIDTGVSGAIALQMAEMMAQMGEKMQVISITHLPQIAAKGKNQYKVYKEDTADATHTRIKQLTEKERIKEIAQMLSGTNLTDASIANAKELLNV